MNKIIRLITLLLFIIPQSLLAKVIILKDGNFINDVEIISQRSGITNFTQNNNLYVWSIDTYHVDSITEKVPVRGREISTNEFVTYFDSMDSIKYAEMRKEPFAAAALACLPVFGIGHIYAGDWARGLLFFAAEALLFQGFISTLLGSSGSSDLPGILLGATYAVKVWEIIDAGFTAHNYNKKLSEKPSLSVDPSESGVKLVLKHHF